MTEEQQAQEQSTLSLNPDVVVKGMSFFYSPAHQHAKHICNRTYSEYRLSCDYGFTNATLYIERILNAGGCFVSAKYEEKKCIGVLNYDTDINRLILFKTNVNTEIHEFHKDDKRQMDECFGIQYEIFKYLRDSDVIKICTVERKTRHKQRYIYIINKLKAAKNGRFLHFTGYGTQFFIPKADFKCIEGGKVKSTGTKKKK